MCWSLGEEEESHAREKRVRVQKEAVNSSTLLLTPTISKEPNSVVREVFVESSKESRLSNQMTWSDKETKNSSCRLEEMVKLKESQENTCLCRP